MNHADARITGTSRAGFVAAGRLVTLDNSGTIEGPAGTLVPGSLEDVVNRTGGVMRGTVEHGLKILGTVDTVTNHSGACIDGLSAGMSIGSGGRVASLVNAGTITDFVNAGTLGDGT